MKIIVALDSFKGSLSAEQACEIVAHSISLCLPAAVIVMKPMADGGEGTAKAFIKSAGGRWMPRTVMGPLPEMQAHAGFVWLENDHTALIEMATASGIELLKREQLNPLVTTTYGTGQLIKMAAEYGAERILLAVGGSATVDGGTGAATALSWRFLDKAGIALPFGGGFLDRLDRIMRPDHLVLPRMEVLCDVDTPLCGTYGAAPVFGPQKGATPEMVDKLSGNMSHLARVCLKQLKCDIGYLPKGGAAGGLAAGAVAFMNATLVSGIETIMKHTHLIQEMRTAEWIITGEGRFDQQSMQGKVVSGISKAAVSAGRRIAVLAGDVTVAKEDYQKMGITAAIGCKKGSMSLDYSIANVRRLLSDAAQELANNYLV